MNFDPKQITQAQIDLCINVFYNRIKNKELAKEMVFTTIERLLVNKTQIRTSLTAYIVEGARLNWINYNKKYEAEIKAVPLYLFVKDGDEEEKNVEEPICLDRAEPEEVIDAKRTFEALKKLIKERLPPKGRKWYSQYLLAGGKLPACYKAKSPKYNSMKTHIRLAKATLKKELEKYGL